MEYTLFYGGVFSQWYGWNNPPQFNIDGINYNCAEQYMMAEKARLFEDKVAEAKIMNLKHPKDQKAWGRKVKNFVGYKWQKVAKDIVYKGNHAKFTQNEELLKELKRTGDTLLVEASPYDRIWGIGLGTDDSRRFDKKNWQGTNWLGEILTKLRDDLE